MTDTPTSYEDVLTQLGIEVSAIRGQEIEAHCPFHEDRHPSFYMHKKTGMFICFQCSASGSLPTLIKQISGKDIDVSAYLREARYKDFGVKKSVGIKQKIEVVRFIDPMLLYARYSSFANPPNWAIKQRMIHREMAESYGLKWDKGWVIPMWDPQISTTLWGWQFKRLKYVSNYPPSIKKSQTLFGLRELVSHDSVALVESPLDVVRLASAQVPAVASFGAFVSKAQIQLLIENARTVVLALDADEEGQRQIKKLLPYMVKFVDVEVVEFPKGAKDPGDLVDRQVRGLFK